eukprot:TRINITY_DN2933_c0_g1_i1.p3 TRINITY_DN2933_c0_g1~~TRINITY_DN2933_c0_g1_i1.p3  ORF type:complete len:101 (+),score=22.67 TRINITY_DN2933_c0_g1_i1:134-436(+)
MDTEQASIIVPVHNATHHHHAAHNVGDAAEVFSRTSLSYFILYCVTGVITLALGAYWMFLKNSKNTATKKQSIMDQVSEPIISEKQSCSKLVRPTLTTNH